MDVRRCAVPFTTRRCASLNADRLPRGESLRMVGLELLAGAAGLARGCRAERALALSALAAASCTAARCRRASVRRAMSLIVISSDSGCTTQTGAACLGRGSSSVSDVSEPDVAAPSTLSLGCLGPRRVCMRLCAADSEPAEVDGLLLSSPSDKGPRCIVVRASHARRRSTAFTSPATY